MNVRIRVSRNSSVSCPLLLALPVLGAVAAAALVTLILKGAVAILIPLFEGAGSPKRYTVDPTHPAYAANIRHYS